MPSKNLIINILLLLKEYEKSWIGNGDLLNVYEQQVNLAYRILT